jgi:hypothetical protein
MEQMVLEPVRAGMAIHELILEAHQDNLRERRSAARHPFFRPVTIRGQGPECVAFSREISTVGIGLLHNVELKQGDHELTITNKRGHVIRVRARIVWCQPCGDGWYISGGQFTGIAASTG